MRLTSPSRPIVRVLLAVAINLVISLLGITPASALLVSTTTVTSSVNPSVFGQTVTFTAVVSGLGFVPTGTVTFQDAGVNIAGCIARPLVAGTTTCVAAGLSTGAHPITGIYSGDVIFNASTSAALTQTVNKGNTATALASSANPSVSGQTVTFTATVTATAPASGTRTGTVDFRDGGVSIAGCGAQPVAVAGTATCAVAFAGPGSHTVSAVYSGDGNFNTSTSANLTQTVNKGNTTTVMTSSANPSVTGQSVTYTATVAATAPASGPRTGTVDIRDGGVSIAGCGAQPVSVGGTATCTVAYAGPASHTISGVYSGDGNFNTSTSANLTETVNKGTTTTVVTSSVNPSVAGESVTYTATVTVTAPASGTATGTVNFRDAAVTIAGCGAQAVSIAGTATCTVTYAVAAAHTISGIYSGDANFNTSTSANLTQTVSKGSTTTALTSSVNPSVWGESITYTATVTANAPAAGTPTGTVTFQRGGVNIAGCLNRAMVAGVATCTTAAGLVGANSITAIYAGDANFLTSTSAPLTQTVGQDTTTTVLGSSANPSVVGQSVTYTATVTADAPGSGARAGTVNFQDSGVTIAGCGAKAVAVAGTATCVVTYAVPGSHTVTGIYSGDANFSGGTSAPLTQTVNKGDTSTALGSAANPSVSGQSVTYTATVTATAPASGTRTGTVDFQDGGISIAGCGARPVAVAGTATCAIAYAGPGSHTVSALYSGDANFNASTSANLTQTVNKGNTTTTLASSANPSVSGQTVTFTATVTATAPASGTRTGTVDFRDGGVSIAGCGAQPVAVAGTATCAVAFAGPGSHTVSAVYSGDGNFNTSTSANLTQTVNKGNTTTVMTSSANPSVTGQSVTYTATVAATAPASGTRTGTVDIRDGGVSIAGCGAQPVSVGGTATCTVTYAGPASHTISGVYSGDANFNTSTSANLTQTVNKGNTVTAVTSSVNPSVTGQSVTYTATVTVRAPASGTATGTVNFRDAAVTIAGCGAQPVSIAGTATCTVIYAAAATHTISGIYSGDANFNTSTSANLTQTVSKGSTTTALTSSVNPSVSGESVTYTATVTANAPAAGTPTGTVNFRDGGVSIAGCGARVVSVAGMATCTVTYAAAATHTISGIYSGDVNFNTSTSPNLTQTANKGDTTTAVTSSVNPSVSGQSVTYTAIVAATAPASGTRTGTVDFRAGGVSIAGCAAQVVSLAGTAACTVTYAGPGSRTISGIYSGDASFNASTSPNLTQTVNQDPTTTALSSSANPSVSGQSVTFTATVTSNAPGSGTPTGSVDFSDGGITIAGCGAQVVSIAGTATCGVTYPSAGSHSITAAYSGDPDFLASTSAALIQTVNLDPTTTTLGSSANPSVSGETVTYTATVTASAPGSGTPTGTVNFRDAGVTIAGCGAQGVSVAGTATCGATYASAGSHSITAVYSGDLNFLASTSAMLTQTVNQDPTTTALSSSANPSVSGQSVIFTATVTANAPGSGTPTGTVDFQDGGVTIAGCGAQVVSLAGMATCGVTYAGAGSHSLTAVYSGDTNFLASTSGALLQTVGQDSTTAALSSSANPSVSGQSITFTATVTANPPGAGIPTGTVTFQDGGVDIAACINQALVAGTATCGVTYPNAGSHAIIANYSGDPNFLSTSSALLTQTVNQDGTTTTLGSSANPSVSGQSLTYTAAVTANAPGSGTPTGTVNFRDGGVTIAGCGAQVVSIAGTATCTVTYAGAGSHSITAVYGGDANFLASTSAALLQTVSQDSTTTTLGSSANPSVTGQSVTYTASVTANAPGSGTPTGTATFRDAGVTIAACSNQTVIAGTATCGVTYPSVGSHSITALYSGDPDFLSSISPVLTQSVNQNATTTSLSSSANPTVFGQPITFTAIVTANLPGSGTPTGTVTFQDGGANIPGCAGRPLLGGVATCNDPPVGTHSITASYSGDLNFLASGSAALAQTVNRDATTTALGSSPNPSVAGQVVNYTATITADPPGSGTPTGSVTFRDGGVNVPGCVNLTLSGGTAICGTAAAEVGSHSVNALYSGDVNFLTSTSASMTQIVLPSFPDTSVPGARAGMGGNMPPDRAPAGWLALLALIAGIGWLGIAALRRRRYGARFRRDRDRLAIVSITVLCSLGLGTVAASQVATHPATRPSSPAASAGPVEAAGGLTTGSQLIGDKVVTVAKPAVPVAESSHPAGGPIVPTRLRIASIGVDAPVVGVGLLKNGSMDVPDNLWTSAWLSTRARPGSAGTSVIAGHRGIDSPAIFSHLESVRPGDRISVSDAAGGELVYEVTRVASLDLSAASQVEVYGPSAEPRLVLITCFGKYSNSTRTYDHRLVVFSRLLGPNSTR